MRRGMNPSVIVTEDEKIVGLNLGADFVAEHEWGITKMMNSLGVNIPEKTNIVSDIIGKLSKKESLPNMGVNARKITNVESVNVYEFKHEKKDYVMMTNSPHVNYGDKFNIPRDLTPYGSKEMWTSWDESYFGIVVSSKKRNIIDNLYDEMKNNNVLVTLAGGHMFENSGLCFIVISEMEEKYKQEMYDADYSRYKLRLAVDKMGIEQKLKKDGKTYYALSPRWKEDSEDEIIFWLNPSEQSRNNSGWVTEQDLLDWIDGKGKIPKTNN